MNGAKVHERSSEGENGTPVITELTVLQKLMFSNAVVGLSYEQWKGGIFDEDNFSGTEAKQNGYDTRTDVAQLLLHADS